MKIDTKQAMDNLYKTYGDQMIQVEKTKMMWRGANRKQKIMVAIVITGVLAAVFCVAFILFSLIKMLMGW